MNPEGRRISVLLWTGFCLVAAVAISADRVVAIKAGGFSLTSPAFASNARIPSQYSCSGANQSPPLVWRDPPSGASSFALIVRDPDAPNDDFIHWVVFDIPGDARELKASLGRSGPPKQGTNSFGRVGYDGPCPPPGAVHHYRFQLMALDAMLGLGSAATAAEIEAKALSHRLANTELVGEFSR